MQSVWLDGPDPRGPVEVGDWVSSAAYRFSGGRLVMDLGEGLVRIQLDRSELTARRNLVWPASEKEIEEARRRLALIDDPPDSPRRRVP